MGRVFALYTAALPGGETLRELTASSLNAPMSAPAAGGLDRSNPASTDGRAPADRFTARNTRERAARVQARAGSGLLEHLLERHRTAARVAQHAQELPLARRHRHLVTGDHRAPCTEIERDVAAAPELGTQARSAPSRRWTTPG